MNEIAMTDAERRAAQRAARRAARTRHDRAHEFHFKPWNVGRWLIWSLYALVLIVAPLLWTS